MMNKLYMIQIWFDMRRLVELARALHMPIHSVDENYMAHCAMKEIFGDKYSPAPFCLEENNGKFLRMLGYSQFDADRLRNAARETASPMTHDACDWDRFVSKPMPEVFLKDREYHFELRVCPVVRKAGSGKFHDSGTEVDAFLSRVWEVNDPSVTVSREEVYQNWLERKLAKNGGAELLDVDIKNFSLNRMMRRTQGKNRKAVTIKRPDVTFEGLLKVKKPVPFAKLLAEGIGRHKSFGYGMLKIRRL